MVVLPLESLPLGFRFHPTDEELINHYLKGKINGCKPQIEVIPEIDVCKCEPWDLPDKSLIRTNDPEWFFFAPRDRKYPNGHRSNRATEKGYWKATGKDRTIKSRVLSGTMLIGMKKTLVFYRGRAPKGERTCWIMHEYRTVDSEVDGATSDQGAYVLCRLFKKPEERSLSSNCDEIDESGLSPTPTKLSPGDAQHSIDQGMDSEREIIQEIKMQEMREDHQLVVEGAETEPDVIESWLTDGVEHASYPPNLEDSNSNSNIASDIGDHEVELAQLHDNVHLGTPFCLLETDGFPQISSPMPYLDLQLYELDPQLGSFPVDSTEQDSVTEFLDSVLSNYDDNNSGDSNADTLSDQVAHVCGANVVSDNMQSWGFDDGSPSYTNTEGYLLGLEGGYYSQKSSKIGCDEMGNDACKVDAKATTLCYASDFQGLLDSYEGLQTRKISLDTDGDNFVGAGIQIRPTPLRHFSSETSSRQGTARQRIRLQNKLQVGLHVGLPACSEVTESGSPTHDSKIKTTAIEAEVDLQAPKENEPTGSEITSQFGSSDHGETSLTEETLDANEIVGESKPLLRLRKSSNNSHPVPRGPTLKPQYAKGSPLVYLAAGGLSVLFVVLIAGMIKYLII